MTTRSPRRILLGSVAIAATLLATATPASAATSTIKSAGRGAEISVTDCPMTAGQACRAFVIDANLKLSPLGIETKSFAVVAYPAVSGANGTISNGGAISAASKWPTGTFTVALNGKTATIRFTVDLTCFVPSCAISGPHTFSISISRNPTTSKLTVHVVNDTDDQPNCLDRSTTTEIEHKAFKGTGTVKAGGSTKKLRVYLPNGENNVFSAKFIVEKRSLTCPAEV